MIAAFAVLLLFQLAGEILVQLSGVPVPGPVLGMVLLFVALLLRGSVPRVLRVTGQTLLEHLSLLFIPAGVGILLHIQRVADEWFAILVALLLSTLLSLAVTALIMAAVIRFIKRGKAGHG